MIPHIPDLSIHRHVFKSLFVVCFPPDAIFLMALNVDPRIALGFMPSEAAAACVISAFQIRFPGDLVDAPSCLVQHDVTRIAECYVKLQQYVIVLLLPRSDAFLSRSYAKVYGEAAQPKQEKPTAESLTQLVDMEAFSGY
eukprot:TRINITY_DN2639_c0_g2_i1.p1 TRINITY_DN2639_c0_g2~~TRINITY_DN2639_c0_g2_i1.p1  ORF type:complete len:140 (+),score=7.13 TRINITY_DN2639_c0_g2_i1:383-802(+)